MILARTNDVDATVRQGVYARLSELESPLDISATLVILERGVQDRFIKS